MEEVWWSETGCRWRVAIWLPSHTPWVCMAHLRMDARHQPARWSFDLSFIMALLMSLMVLSTFALDPWWMVLIWGWGPSWGGLWCGMLVGWWSLIMTLMKWIGNPSTGVEPSCSVSDSSLRGWLHVAWDHVPWPCGCHPRGPRLVLIMRRRWPAPPAAVLVANPSHRWRPCRTCAVGYPALKGLVTWLILPVVICLSQRLSHACLSISNYTAKLRMAH